MPGRSPSTDHRSTSENASRRPLTSRVLLDLVLSTRSWRAPVETPSPQGVVLPCPWGDCHRAPTRDRPKGGRISPPGVSIRGVSSAYGYAMPRADDGGDMNAATQAPGGDVGALISD